MITWPYCASVININGMLCCKPFKPIGQKECVSTHQAEDSTSGAGYPGTCVHAPCYVKPPKSTSLSSSANLFMLTEEANSNSASALPTRKKNASMKAFDA